MDPFAESNCKRNARSGWESLELGEIVLNWASPNLRPTIMRVVPATGLKGRSRWGRKVKPNRFVLYACRETPPLAGGAVAQQERAEFKGTAI